MIAAEALLILSLTLDPAACDDPMFPILQQGEVLTWDLYEMPERITDICIRAQLAGEDGTFQVGCVTPNGLSFDPHGSALLDSTASERPVIFYAVAEDRNAEPGSIRSEPSNLVCVTWPKSCGPGPCAVQNLIKVLVAP